MANPFPGMNPWLEEYWRDVHTRLLTYLCDAIQEQLPADLVAVLEEKVAIDVEGERASRNPDVWVTDGGLPTGTATAVRTSATAIAQPLLVLDDEPSVERHIEIRNSHTGGAVVTAIELLNVTNKLTTEGRRDYRTKRAAYVAAGVNVVEIDLIRDGDYNLGA